MQLVRIANAGVAHPPLRLSQEDAARAVAALAGDRRRIAALARGTHIDSRAIVLPPDELAALGTIEERNAIYRGEAHGIARHAAEAALGEAPREQVGCLVTSSCTGYALPGWGVELVGSLGLGGDTVRLPVTEAGCAGGAVALARAADYLRSRPGQSAVAAAAELCSLAFHKDATEANLTSALIFGDGAGAALLQTGPGRGLAILDSMSVLIPGSGHLLGFDLTDHGFYPVLRRELVDHLPSHVRAAAQRLLTRNRLALADIGAWLVHPGGARILDRLEHEMRLTREQMRWSWESMREFGNTSSAAVFDVIRRYMEDGAPGRYAIIAAFGPGVSIELLLVESSC